MAPFLSECAAVLHVLRCLCAMSGIRQYTDTTHRRHSGLYVYNIDSRYIYFRCHVFIIYKICKVNVFYGLQVSNESYVLVFFIGTHLMMARESRNM
jgi:hypothetical protein